MVDLLESVLTDEPTPDCEICRQYGAQCWICFGVVLYNWTPEKVWLLKECLKKPSSAEVSRMVAAILEVDPEKVEAARLPVAPIGQPYPVLMICPDCGIVMDGTPPVLLYPRQSRSGTVIPPSEMPQNQSTGTSAGMFRCLFIGQSLRVLSVLSRRHQPDETRHDRNSSAHS